MDENTNQEETAEQVYGQVKKGFSLKDRLEKRGLRRVTISLFLDENLGADHLQKAEQIEALDKQIKKAEQDCEIALSVKGAGFFDKERLALASLEDSRPALEAELQSLEDLLKADALVVALRAVPPVMAKDCRRRARDSCGVTEKNVPDDKAEEFVQSYNAHMLALTVQSITDSSTGDVNDSLSYADAMELIDYLPTDQYQRLAGALQEVQFRDSFSKTIEGQEDFS